jgi:hypothetical protein
MEQFIYGQEKMTKEVEFIIRLNKILNPPILSFLSTAVNNLIDFLYFEHGAQSLALITNPTKNLQVWIPIVK